MGQENLNYLRDSLLNHEVYIDSEELWKGISTKRRKAFYLRITFFSVVLIALISFIGIRQLNSDNNNFSIKGNLANTNELNPVRSLNNDNSTPTESSVTNKSIYSEISAEKLDKSKSEIIRQNTETENLNNPSLNVNNNDPGQSFSTTKAIEKQPKSVNSEQTTENRETTTGAEISETTSETIKVKVNKPGYLQNLPLLGRSGAVLSYRENSFDYQSKDNGIDCYDHSGRKMDLYLLGYTALDFVMPTMTALNDFGDYLEDRKSSQKQLTGYRAGLQLKYLAENGLYLKGGLEYGEARERFEYRRTTEIDTVLPDQLIEINIDLNGDTTLIYGNAPVKIIEMKNWKVGNKYKSFGAHLLAGYQMDKGQFIYGFEAGVQYNISLKFNGMLLNDKLDPIDAANYFKSNSQLSLLGGINLGYRMNELWTIYGSLDYIGNLSNINSSANLVDQKNRHVGLSLGLELKI